MSPQPRCAPAAYPTGVTLTDTFEALAAGGVDDAIDRRDVGVIAADGQHHVIIAGKDVVGRIEPAPADLLAAPHQHPCMHGVGAFELVFLGVEGPEIAADIGRGQSEPAHSGNHDVGEVLADAATQRERHRRCRRCGGRADLVDEVGLDPPHEIDGGVEHGPSRRKALGGIGADFRIERNLPARETGNAPASSATDRVEANAASRISSHGGVRPACGGASLLTATRAATRTLKHVVRLIELDPGHPVAEEIVAFAPLDRGGLDVEARWHARAVLGDRSA